MTNDQVQQRAAGVSSLRQYLPLLDGDVGAQTSRKMLRRLDHQEAVRK